ncbi:MAG: cytochrome P460 family protein [Pseudomonadota bacterium]
MKFILGTVLISLASLAPAVADDRVELPDDYRDSFVKYLSLDRVQNHDQFIRLFADPVAMQGTDDSGQLADGSRLVAEVYSVVKDDDGQVVESALGRRIKDQLILIAVMEKNQGWGQTSESAINVGDWDFGAFKPDGTVAGKNLDACRACHAPLTSTDFLFSIDHLPNTTDDGDAE